ncbi:MAG: hypothetical protein QOF78_1432 [Phycisphaerales bacterium]|jgi:uncharacterized protein YegJ (DUF2314 family)|nr:hypothetical protein [Phycisphaerales bacterium]
MFNWRNRSVDLLGSVFFRGSMPPRAADFEFLTQHGVRLEPRDPGNENVHWLLRASHDSWGDADILCPRGMPRPPRIFIEFDPDLTPDEKETAAAGETPVLVRTQGSKEDVLTDRKSLLRYLGAVMANDGVVAMDLVSHRMWSRAALDDELSHDADVDIVALYTLHAVGSDSRGEADGAEWLHTHGLAELGFFDFDILQPSEALEDTAADALRAIAFAIVEGEVTKSTPRWQLAYPKGDFRFVDVAEFNRRAEPAIKRLRGDDPDHDEDHNRDRAVLCEPSGKFLGQWFDKLRPSKFLSSGFDEEGMCKFSAAASDLSEARAKLTYPLFRALAAELKEFEMPTVAKIGYAVDDAEDDEREYLWFEVHEFFDDAIDGTLANEPFRIARMKAGQRGRHGIERMNDWVIFTPIGTINPRTTRAARAIRAKRDEFRTLLAEAKAASMQAESES